MGLIASIKLKREETAWSFPFSVGMTGLELATPTSRT